MYNQGYNEKSGSYSRAGQYGDKRRENTGYGNRSGNYNQRGPRKDYQKNDTPAAPIEALPLPGDYLDQAEKLMQSSEISITTSKIRRLYSLATEVYNEERLRTEQTLTEGSIAAVGMMRVRIAYECGRDDKVKAFVQKAKLLEYLKGIGDSRVNFIRYTQYMEALVAYHKFFGGREN